MNSFLRRLTFVFILTMLSMGAGLVVSQQGGRVPLRSDQIAATMGIDDFTWSPDGKSIAYISLQAGTSDIWVVASTGGAPQRLISSSTLKKQPRWSKDAKWIAFIGIQPGNIGELYAANVADQTVTNLTEGTADVRNPAWSPDSKQI